ncbi:hypothetical protein NPIL_641221 [Nephila pilipes]|uniref:Uncharacterized protein n=1 Tax=Nephila pilipes TaxID=299642 RepID=A0A8X6QVX3_NEPPI|nr:hypothetical protein NPIL_641221 [Nephila pilipes]
MCTCSNQELGGSNFPILLLVYRNTFARLHCKHVRADRVTSSLSYTYRSATNFSDALIPRCKTSCKLLKISRLRNSVTNGKMRSFDTPWRMAGSCPIERGCSTRIITSLNVLRWEILLQLLGHLFEVNSTWCGGL